MPHPVQQAPAPTLYERLNALEWSQGGDGYSVFWFGAANVRITLETMADMMCDSLSHHYPGVGKAISLVVPALTPDEIVWMLSYTWRLDCPQSDYSATASRITADFHTAVMCALGSQEDE